MELHSELNSNGGAMGSHSCHGSFFSGATVEEKNCVEKKNAFDLRRRTSTYIDVLVVPLTAIGALDLVGVWLEYACPYCQMLSVILVRPFCKSRFAMRDWDVRTSGRPDVRTSGRPDVGTSGRPDVGTSGRPDVRSSKSIKITYAKRDFWQSC